MSKAITTPLTLAARKKIVEDLAQKFPFGPEGKKKGFKREDYSSCEYYSGFYERHVTLPVLKTDRENQTGWGQVACVFGYDDLTFYKLNFNGPGDIYYFLQDEMDYESGRGARMRANRVWERIGRSIQIIRRHGSTGIYEVVYGYSGREKCFVYGDTKNDAIVFAKSMLNPAFGKPMHFTPEIRFKGISPVTGLATRNDARVVEMKHFAEEIEKEAREKLAEALKLAERFKSRAEMVQNVAGFQLIATLEEENLVD